MIVFKLALIICAVLGFIMLRAEHIIHWVEVY